MRLHLATPLFLFNKTGVFSFRIWAMMAVVASASVIGCSDRNALVLKTETFRLAISKEGQVVQLQDESNGTEYVSRPSPLLQLRKQGEFVTPQSARAKGEGLELVFPGGFVAQISVEEKDTHLVFELVELSQADSVDLVLWGPFATSIDKSIGETVGVARGESFGIGLQALNIKTLGGYPWNENDAMPEMDIFEGGNYHDMDPAKSRSVLYRVEAAKPDSMGSTLQAYTRNRSVDRIIKNQGYDRYVAPAYDDGGVIGSKIALFGVPVQQTLATIGEIEVAEGLPHPMIDGVWGKMSPTANAAYIIMNFSEETAEKAMDIVEKAGLRYLYHDGLFETWGHFKINEKSFPDGVASLKRISTRASERGLMVGTHNLSNFVTTNDPYVTPIPDARLAKVGGTKLSEDLSVSLSTIAIESPDFFNQGGKSYLMAAQIEDEIVKFTSVSQKAPWQLLGVERGAFGTTASTHASGAKISKLDDHGYMVFLTETALSVEMATTLAKLYNETGFRQISFDGLEGNRSTGMGNYGESLFAQAWYDNLNDDIRSHYIADASRTTHYFWHMYTRMNWGEPWYAGFRESQTEYRLKNQAYFERNLMPGMLGWFKMTPETSVEDIEWMLSLSAGYDAGYGFVTSYDAVEKNGKSDEILRLLGVWEKLRLGDVFSEDQKALLRSRDQEFHLSLSEDGAWTLTPSKVHIFRRFNRERQPGEPLESNFTFESGAVDGPVSFILTADGGSASRIRFTLDNNASVEIPLGLKVGESLVYRGGTEAFLVDRTWHELRSIPMDPAALGVGSGSHSLSLTADINGDSESSLRVEIRLKGQVLATGALPGK
ncbi:MAG: hypothetical protein O3B41_01375 [Bacteroidetes bacterium]|nr:hypothetical protein [Bacteroidota bacterium]